MKPMAGRLRNWGGDLLRGRTASTSRAVVGLLLVLAWTIGLQVGTLSGGAQLLFVPVVFAALTLSAGEAGLTSILAAVLAGPLLPADVRTAVAQEPYVWLLRGLLFLVAGQVTSSLVHRRRELERRLEPYEQVARGATPRPPRYRRSSRRTGWPCTSSRSWSSTRDGSWGWRA